MSVGVNDNKISDGMNFVAPDGGWGWIIVFSSLLIHVIMDGITYAFGQYLRIFIDDFNASYSAVAVIHGLLPAVTLSCGPIGSSLTNRFGCRITTIIGTLIATIGFVLSCFVTNLYYLYVTIGVIVGIGFGLIYVPAIVSVGYYFEKWRSLAIGIAVCGSGIGTFLLAPLNRYLLDKYDWQGAFLIKAGIIFNICVCACVMIPVAIEPSEISRRKKKLEKLIQEKYYHPTKIITKSIKEDIESDNKNKFLQVLPKNCSDSKPSVIKHQLHNNIETNLPPITEGEKIKSQEDALLKSYSSLNFIASMHSLKNINELSEKKNCSNTNLSEAKKIIIANENKMPKNEDNVAFDPKILLNFLFVFFAISNFLTSLGFNAPYIYINDQAQTHGISKKNADILIQIIGILNMIGRIILGFLSTFFNGFQRLYLYASVISICGIATMIEPFLTNFSYLIGYSAVFGFTSGGYVSLTALILVDLMGLENLSNAFGMLLVFQGIATAIGPPIAGAMLDLFKSYTPPFLFIGSMIAISGLICYFYPCFKSYRNLTKSNK